MNSDPPPSVLEAASALRESEELFRTLCSRAPVGIFTSDSEGKCTFINDAAAKLIGITPEQAVECGCRTTIHPADRQRVEETWAKLVANRDGFSSEHRFQHADGTLVWVQGDAAPRHDKHGMLMGFIGTLTDITARKQAEDYLEAENRLLRIAAQGSSFRDSLRKLADFIEEQADDLIASLMILDSDGKHLRHGATPSLPAAFNDALDGLAVEEGPASRATPIFGRCPVFVTDIQADPLWKAHRELARDQGLRACWSTPITDPSGRVLGTLAVYRRVVGGPTPQHRKLIDAATHIASILMTRHRDERELRESEARFRTIFEQAAVGVAQIDSPRGTIIRVNQRYCEVLGRAEGDLIGKTWMELTHPDDLPAGLSQMQRLRAGEIREFNVEKRLQRQDGSFAWIDVTVSAMWPRGEQPTTHISIVQDITQRKAAESQLRLTQFSVDSCSTPVTWVRRDASIRYVNDAAVEHFAYTRDELLSMTIHDIDPSYPPEVWPGFWARMQQKRPMTFKTQTRRRDGKLVPVEITTNLLEFEGEELVFAFVKDITASKQAEETLAFQADVLNRVSDAVMVTDREGKTVAYANEVAEKLFQISKRAGQSLPELHDEILVSGPNSDVIRENLERTGSWQGENEFRIQRQTLTMETKINVLRLPGSDEQLLMSVCRDISARKKAEQERRQHRDALAHMTRLSTMGELVAGIAHEVKQPLYAIGNFSTAASISLRNAEQSQGMAGKWFSDLSEFNDGIRRSSQRANEIIERLREFARKGEQQRESIDINRIVNESIDLVAFESRQCDAMVETQLQKSMPEVVGDRIQCQQVVVNLLHNAYEALATQDQPRRVVVRTAYCDGHVEIQVEDNGPGIPPDQKGKLFEAFATTKPSGMGIGLTISRTIVEDHGGRLWVSSNERGTTVFHVLLPVMPVTSPLDVSL